MKKILFAFMAMYCFIACDPSDSFADNEGEWWVKNDTNEAIGIWCDWTFMEPKLEKVMPGDSLHLYTYYCYINTDPVFDGLLTSTEPDGDRKISFFSSDGSLLKEWFVRDKDEAGNRFFNENNWRKYKMVLLSGSGCMTSHLMMLSGKILMLKNEAFDSDIGEKQL